MKMDNGRETILELERIVKIYRTKGSFLGAYGKDVIALNKISIKILRGEIFGLVGESGSGKTTAGRLIVRLEKQEEGKIYLSGREMTGLKGKALKDFLRKVQMIFQDPYQSLNPQLSVFDAISEPLIIHKIGNAGAREDAVWQVMKSVGLSPPDDFANRYPHQLSGGQRQRVAIARAMVLNPEFVVADEPTSMLDASISAQIFNILLDMRDKFQVTLLFITHSLSAARYLCDRIAVIYKGNMMEMGSADQVIQNPKHPYTQALIDALPKFGQCGEVKHYGTLLMEERDGFSRVGCPFFSRCGVAHRLKCSRERPLLKETGDSHYVACFYAENGVGTGSESRECYYGM
ncbi:MAG: ABC transporter ATP-binding protein [Desulfobacteraceae bacterium]|nr:MAG: ABC transporter ATP-binding protein [Desulfobacteraceae bacterium]